MNPKKHLKTLLLAVLLSLSCLLTAACGAPGEDAAGGTSGAPGVSGTGTGGGTDAAGGGNGQAAIYLPSFQSMTGAESGSCRNLEVNCGFLYYSVRESGADGQGRRRFYRQSLMEEGIRNAAQELYADAEAWEELAADTYTFFTDAKGYGYFILRKAAADTGQEQYFLCKYGVSGSELFRRDITPEMTAQTADLNLFRRAVTDGEGRIYIGRTEAVCLYDRDGNLHTEVPMPGELKGMDCGRDGAVYVTCHTGRELVLEKVDFEKGTLEEIYSGFPGDGALSGGTAYDILTMDQQAVYGFSAGMEQPEKVLDWTDSDLYGNEIAYIHGLEDGKLLAVADGAGGVSQLVLLAPPGAEGRPAKEVITIGVMDYRSSQELDTLLAGFNRSSEKYRAELVIYGEGTEGLEGLLTAIDKANLAILTGDSPDLISLDRQIVLDMYAKKGVLEDLGGYLENSGVIHRDDLLETALDLFTYEDKLYGMPRGVYLWTIVGRTSQVGEEAGWTIEDMEQLVRGHPDARLFRTCTKSEVLHTLMMYDMRNYVDWLEGTCRFDSEEFREVLEFVNSFPLEQLPDEDLTLENGGILLGMEPMICVSSYTYWREAFGDDGMTCIGFPSRHGCGTMLDVAHSTFGISALSEHKEGAWEFLEFMLTDDTMIDWMFPVNKALLERNFLDALGQDYVYDEAGNILYDENGKPLTRELFTERYGTVPIQEDVDAVRHLLETAEPSNLSWGDIYKIINEETAPYFHGQKTLDEVVDIIQRRAQLCVSENQ